MPMSKSRERVAQDYWNLPAGPRLMAYRFDEPVPVGLWEELSIVISELL